MPGTKQRSSYKKKRPSVFRGHKSQTFSGGDVSHDETKQSTNTSPIKVTRSELKVNANCPLLQAESKNIVTRQKAHCLGFRSSSDIVKAHSFKIIDVDLLQNCIFNSAICSSCKLSKSKLQLWQDNSQRAGLKEQLILKCNLCHHQTFLPTSKNCFNTNSYAEINVRSVLGGISCGVGQSSLQQFCYMLNIARPITNYAYNKLLKDLYSIAQIESKICITQAADNVKRYLIKNDRNYLNSDILDVFSIAVTVDGTWQKRYGFNSLLGVVFVLSVDTGEVLDYEVKIKHCFECRARNKWNKNNDRYKIWYEIHKPNCSINHTTSAESMEKDSVVELFSRSLSLHNLKYTTYVGDGDSSSFAVVRDAMLERYPDYIVVKEDCVGHIQKRMGTNLRNYKKDKKGHKLVDGFTVGGRGRLTKDVIDKFQNYYGAAIRKNSNSLKNMQNAIWAIYFHSILGKGETLSQQHRFCPSGTSSWCRYQQDIVNRTNKYNQAKCLPSVFRDELKRLFSRLSESELLQRCLKGITQNQNEALNSVLWSICPKRIFCGKIKLTVGVTLAIIQWNSGAAGLSSILTSMGVNQVGANTNAGFRKKNLLRLKISVLKSRNSSLNRRQQLRQNRKRKFDNKPSYSSGGFSIHPEPDSIVNKKIRVGNYTEISITFVDDSSLNQSCWIKIFEN